jgi:hypothetical protein
VIDTARVPGWYQETGLGFDAGNGQWGLGLSQNPVAAMIGPLRWVPDMSPSADASP